VCTEVVLRGRRTWRKEKENWGSGAQSRLSLAGDQKIQDLQENRFQPREGKR